MSNLIKKGSFRQVDVKSYLSSTTRDEFWTRRILSRGEVNILVKLPIDDFKKHESASTMSLSQSIWGYNTIDIVKIENEIGIRYYVSVFIQRMFAEGNSGSRFFECNTFGGVLDLITTIFSLGADNEALWCKGTGKFPTWKMEDFTEYDVRRIEGFLQPKQSITTFLSKISNKIFLSTPVGSTHIEFEISRFQDDYFVFNGLNRGKWTVDGFDGVKGFLEYLYCSK